MTRPRTLAAGAALALLSLVAASACTGPQHALATRGPAAERIAALWWVMLAIAAAVSVAVIVLLALAIRQSRAREQGRAAREIDGRALVLLGGIAIPAVILFGVLIFSYRVSTDVYGGTGDPDALVIEVVGHLYWWEVRYPQHGVVTANEIHLPAGREVLFRVSSPDVIHSFWIPQLHGKIDMIPGQVHTLRVTADEPGTFRGQCAEFCGEAHALMAMWVTAHEPEEFESWLAARRVADDGGSDPASGDDAQENEQADERGDAEVHEHAHAHGRADEDAQRGATDQQTRGADQSPGGAAAGRAVFFTAGCGDCHATRGASHPASQGTTAPDLSHLATRRMLAAGTIPNTRPMLRAWILAPDEIKPGSLMPPTDLPIEEMDALLDYLETLR